MVEFIRPSKTVSMIYGIYHAMIKERLDGDALQINQTYSYAYGENVVLDSAVPRSAVFLVPTDYYYHLDYIRGFYPTTAAGANESPAIRFQLFQWSRNRRFESVPIPFRIVTTPSERQRRQYSLLVNVTFEPRTNIRIEVSGQDGTDPAFVYVMTEGLRIPRQFYITV